MPDLLVAAAAPLAPVVARLQRGGTGRGRSGAGKRSATRPSSSVPVKSTASLRGNGRRERERSVAGAFALAGDATARATGRHIMLIDDAHASGATLCAAVKVLRRSVAVRVSALTWARLFPRH
ncbi:hypothetical protein [Sphingopyxis sp.]|uniref:hypothetical protein n=1 Tax=Sphingopyxis sp. TaxID=1908224 RepID=UPI0025E4D157|nr:hypothetical protein [Sphingopyxis sp.]MBK6411835.1 hypothetical protein [Sphingopyxis sp.]